VTKTHLTRFGHVDEGRAHSRFRDRALRLVGTTRRKRRHQRQRGDEVLGAQWESGEQASGDYIGRAVSDAKYGMSPTANKIGVALSNLQSGRRTSVVSNNRQAAKRLRRWSN
jgi:hypothetical protein